MANMSEAFINEQDLAVTDFSQLLDFDTTAGVIGNPIASLGDRYCPYHPGADDCACHGFLEDWDLPDDPIEAAPQLGLAEPDYSKFENYIPKFIRPEKPCDYCRSKRMSCYVQQGEPFCTPCALLARDCSLFNDTTGPSRLDVSRNHFSNPEVLRVVSEDGTATKPVLSRANSHPKIPLVDDAPGTTKSNGIRFPKHAVKILRDWLDAHATNPYPTEDEKIELERETQLKPSQIANWLANARRRRKVTERSRPKLAMSPSLRPTTAAIPIPIAGAGERSWDELNPLERWKNSPPENEPARMSDIADALAHTDIPTGKASASASPSPRGRYKKRKTSSNGSKISNTRPQSVTSCETGQTSSLSASSAAFSNGSSHSTHGSFSSFNSSLIGKKDRRRRRRPMVAKALDRKPADDKKRIFQCTFCTDTFKSKYDWTRHEKSLHLSLEKWICAPLGPIITDQETGGKKCVYCDLHNPSSDHIESHNHRQCEDKGLDARTFYRKDHLRQHLRLMHACEMVPSTESWKSMAQNINSRCGFCAQRFSVWQERVDHLTAHFKAGVRMAEWKGCRGLDPAVAAQVTNAMPPYLIGMEAVTPNPFSATNRASWRLPEEFNGVQEGAIDSAAVQSGGPNSTCWEILTIRLGQFAKEQTDQGLPITDDLLQRQARRILYDNDDDAWNQTSADNPEWLDLFKKAHGLDIIPSEIGGEGNNVPEDLESYGDLGLRVPFPFQLQVFDLSHYNAASATLANLSEKFKASIDARRAECRRIYTELQGQGVFYDGDQTCGHVECALNMIDASPFDGLPNPGPRSKRWCSEDISPELSAQIASANIATPLHNSRPPAPASGVKRNLLTRLSELDGEMHRFHGSCCPEGPAKNGVANGSAEKRASWDTTTPSSGSSGINAADMRASHARVKGLEALARVEALEDPPASTREDMMQEWYSHQQRSLGAQNGYDTMAGSGHGMEFLCEPALQPATFDVNGEVDWSASTQVPPPPPGTTSMPGGGGLGERSLSQEEMLTQLEELIAASSAPPTTEPIAPMTCGMEVDAAWAMGNSVTNGEGGDAWDATTMETMDFMMDDVEFGFDDLVGGDGSAWAL